MREEEAGTKAAGTGRWLAALAVLGVVAMGVYSSFAPETGTGEVGAALPVLQDTASDEAPVDLPADDGATVPDEPPASREAAAAAAPDPAAQVTPTVDEVRLEADGLAVVAGRAEPGAEVSVRVDGQEVARAVADARGAFAAVGVVEPSDTARVLTLQAQGDGDAVLSEEDVILAPLPAQVADAGSPVQDRASAAPVEERTVDDDIARSEAAPAEVEGRPQSREPELEPQEEIAAASPDPAPNDAPSLSADQNPLAGTGASDAQGTGDAVEPPSQSPSQSVAVLKSTAEGVELLQPTLEASSSVAIDTIGYSSAGEVQLSGRAVVGTSEVRVYLNNRFATALPVDTDGGWRGDLPEVDAGIYQLRVDEVNTAGDVTSRIETPFKREAPVALALADTADRGSVRAVTVQTGDTLWAIARDRYGEGVFYVKVFEANRADIRDPDLIYPGQVFDLPVE